MAVNPVYVSSIRRHSQTVFRITSLSYNTPDRTLHKKIVNGEGAIKSYSGGRYNYPGARTVYLAEQAETCLAEIAYYFRGEVLKRLDLMHVTGDSAPPFTRPIILWAITFRSDIEPILDLLKVPIGRSFNRIIPALATSPTRDYHHLKDRRAAIHSDGYIGMRVKSARTPSGVNLVLFNDQSDNVDSIQPYPGEISLVTPSGSAYSNHESDALDHNSISLRIPGFRLSSSTLPARLRFIG